MGRNRVEEIEKEENRVTAELAQAIVGTRTFREAAEDAQISDPSTLSYICRGKVKPTPEIIRKLTRPEAKPQGGITYDEFMCRAQYQTNDIEKYKELISEMEEEVQHQKKCIESYQKALNEYRKNQDFDLFKYFDEYLNNVDQRTMSQYQEIEETHASKMNNRRHIVSQMEIEVIKVYEIILNGLINAEIGVLKQNKECLIQSTGYRCDAAYNIVVKDNQINKWYMEFKFSNNVSNMDRYRALRGIASVLGLGTISPNTKVSIVINNSTEFELYKRYKDNIAYRGELSVILVDLEKDEIIKEEYLSHYAPDDRSKEFYLV